MELLLAMRVVRGSSADIFHDLPARRAYKLFRRARNDASNRVTRRIFAAESRSYRILEQHPELQRHAPRFFGEYTVTSVRGRQGVSQSSRYLLDCCYSVEWLNGDDLKVFGVPAKSRPAILALMHRFEAVGIQYMADASVFDWNEPFRAKFIDFATSDAAA